MPTRGNTMMSRIGKEPGINNDSNRSQIHLATFPEPHSITKTVETTVVVGDAGSGPTSKDSI